MLLAIMLDAFTPKYLEYDCPFLRNIRDKGVYAETVPSFGFEPDAAYIAGLYPEECDGGMHYLRDEAASPFGWTRGWTRPLAALPPGIQSPIRRLIQLVNLLKEKGPARRFFSRPAMIPLDKLHLFDIAHSRLMYQPGFTPSPTIFDLLNAEGKNCEYFGYPLWHGGVKRMYSLLKTRNLRDLDFAFILLGDLDFAGHTYGTESGETMEALRSVDAGLERIYRLFARHHPELTFVVFGDHGMVDVRGTVDVELRLKGLRSRPWEDYTYFLDSTFARFWFHNDAAHDEIESMLGDLQGGAIVSGEDKHSYRASYPHNRFGDLIFWADGGKLILPNFFQGRREVRGMHGYRREVRDNHSVVLIRDPKRESPVEIEEPVDMVRLFPTFLELLDLPLDHGHGIMPLTVTGV